MNKVAEIKAKYGISNRVVANLFDMSALDVKNHLMGDTFTEDQVNLIVKIENIIEYMIREAELLQEQAPYLMVIEHEKELQEREIIRLIKHNRMVGAIITNYNSLPMWRKLWLAVTDADL